jgi:fluoride exporter
MKAVLLVFLGGGLGSVMRYATGLAALRMFGAGFPMGTLLVNILGCTIMGLLAKLLPASDAGGQAMRLLFMSGFLGGYTTFSAFALDIAGLLERGEGALAFTYLAASILLSLLGLAFGLWLGGMLTAR